MLHGKYEIRESPNDHAVFVGRVVNGRFQIVKSFTDDPRDRELAIACWRRLKSGAPLANLP